MEDVFDRPLIRFSIGFKYKGDKRINLRWLNCENSLLNRFLSSLRFYASLNTVIFILWLSGIFWFQLNRKCYYFSFHRWFIYRIYVLFITIFVRTVNSGNRIPRLESISKISKWMISLRKLILIRQFFILVVHPLLWFKNFLTVWSINHRYWIFSKYIYKISINTYSNRD